MAAAEEGAADGYVWSAKIEKTFLRLHFPTLQSLILCYFLFSTWQLPFIYLEVKKSCVFHQGSLIVPKGNGGTRRFLVSQMTITVADPMSRRSRDFVSIDFSHLLSDITSNITWFGSAPVVRQIWHLLPPPPRAFESRNMKEILLDHEIERSFLRRFSPHDCKLDSSTRNAGWRSTHAAVVVVFLITGHYPCQTIISPTLVHFELSMIIFPQFAVVSVLESSRHVGFKILKREKWPLGSRSALYWTTDSGPRGLGPPLNLDLTKKGNTPPLTKIFGPSWVKEGTLDFFSTVPPSLANLQAPLFRAELNRTELHISCAMCNALEIKSRDRQLLGAATVHGWLWCLNFR